MLIHMRVIHPKSEWINRNLKNLSPKIDLTAYTFGREFGVRYRVRLIRVAPAAIPSRPAAIPGAVHVQLGQRAAMGAAMGAGVLAPFA